MHFSFHKTGLMLFISGAFSTSSIVSNTFAGQSFLTGHIKTYRDNFCNKSSKKIQIHVGKTYYCKYYSARPNQYQWISQNPAPEGVGSFSGETKELFGTLRIDKEDIDNLYIATFDQNENDPAQLNEIDPQGQTLSFQCTWKSCTSPVHIRSNEDGNNLYLELALPLDTQTLDEVFFDRINSCADQDQYKAKSYGVCSILSSDQEEKFRTKQLGNWPFSVISDLVNYNLTSSSAAAASSNQIHHQHVGSSSSSYFGGLHSPGALTSFTPPHSFFMGSHTAEEASPIDSSTAEVYLPRSVKRMRVSEEVAPFEVPAFLPAPSSDLKATYQNQLALSYYKLKKFDKAYPLFLASADQGHAESQYTVAEMLRKGKGCEVNLDRASYYYYKSGESGQLKGYLNYATILATNIKSFADLVEVEYLFRKVISETTDSRLSSVALSNLQQLLEIKPYYLNQFAQKPNLYIN